MIFCFHWIILIVLLSFLYKIFFLVNITIFLNGLLLSNYKFEIKSDFDEGKKYIPIKEINILNEKFLINGDL